MPPDRVIFHSDTEQSTTLVKSKASSVWGKKEVAQECCCNGCEYCFHTYTTYITYVTVLDCPGMFPACWPNSLLADTFTPCRAKDKIRRTDSNVICCLGGLGHFSASKQFSALGWKATVNLFICFTAKLHSTDYSSYLTEGIKELN